MGAGDDDAEDGEEAMWANSQAAISSTPTKPIAEAGFLRYGVRYSSTLGNLPLPKEKSLKSGPQVINTYKPQEFQISRPSAH